MSGGTPRARMSLVQRSCLLRAARKQLEDYRSALDRLMSSCAPPADIEAMEAEIVCMQGAIRWLWLDARADDG